LLHFSDSKLLGTRNADEALEEHFMESILITDDDSGCRDTIKMTLEREGYIVESAVGVDDALSAIRRRSFDLIVCDFRMRGKTGLELLAELQEHGPQIPVLMVSAYADAVTEATFNRLGAAGLLKKPFRRQDLIDSVVRAIH
jgi:DNA-binding NtrC family response regulator